jgi:hypothetical protein
LYHKKAGWEGSPSQPALVSQSAFQHACFDGWSASQLFVAEVLTSRLFQATC